MATQDGDVPPQPKAILRGHKTQIHAATFIRSNERLLTGDADGFVVAWDLTIMRPRCVWQAHENAILGISGWGTDRVITHGRDNKLIVWKLSAEDEGAMSTTLPLDPVPAPRMKPWMLHMLEVNTMNFCSFASSPAYAPGSAPDSPASDHSQLLIAVPNTLASEAVDIYSLPSQNRVHTVKLGDNYGMAMALALVWLEHVLTLVVGYENGMAIVAELRDDGSWAMIYHNQCHKQPILSLDVAPNLEYFLTSSADATIAKHPLLSPEPEAARFVGDAPETDVPKVEPEETHAPDNSKPERNSERKEGHDRPISLLSAALAGQPPVKPSRAAGKRKVQTQPLKAVNTKHAGQQGLRVRSDGRVFATAGWDSKIRVYSAKTMREVAVLKWHPVGCFAVAFADMITADHGNLEATQNNHGDKAEASSDTRLVLKVLDMTVKDKRIKNARKAHWLAAGSKDGKVSLWDVF